MPCRRGASTTRATLNPLRLAAPSLSVLLHQTTPKMVVAPASQGDRGQGHVGEVGGAQPQPNRRIAWAEHGPPPLNGARRLFDTADTECKPCSVRRTLDLSLLRRCFSPLRFLEERRELAQAVSCGALASHFVGCRTPLVEEADFRVTTCRRGRESVVRCLWPTLRSLGRLFLADSYTFKVSQDIAARSATHGISASESELAS